jgi:hypothetical protein
MIQELWNRASEDISEDEAKPGNAKGVYSSTRASRFSHCLA